MKLSHAYHNIIIELIKVCLWCVFHVSTWFLRLEIRAYAILESTIMFPCFDGKKQYNVANYSRKRRHIRPARCDRFL